MNTKDSPLQPWTLLHLSFKCETSTGERLGPRWTKIWGFAQVLTSPNTCKPFTFTFLLKSVFESVLYLCRSFLRFWITEEALRCLVTDSGDQLLHSWPMRTTPTSEYMKIHEWWSQVPMNGWFTWRNKARLGQCLVTCFALLYWPSLQTR